MTPPSEDTGAPMKALHALVLDLFTAEEFRRWLRFGPDADIVPELPGESAADAAVIDKALGALERRGRINAAFFARMTAERMGKSGAIARVAALWGESEPAKANSFRSPSDLAAPIRASDGSKIGGRSFSATSMTGRRTSRENVLASWIHVSDLHFGHGDAGHQWNQQRVLEELLLDAKELVRDGVVPRPDFIFVTGDIAFSGGSRTPVAGGTEYALASQWLRQLQEILEIPSERVFVVPGNHDVDRKADADVRRLLRGARAGEESIDEILQAPLDLGRLRGRMASYLAFAQDFGPGPSDRFHGGLWWRQRVALAEGVSMRICGLNTALLSVDDQDQGKLRISQRQLAELFVPTPGEFELAVVLGHHPVTGRPATRPNPRPRPRPDPGASPGQSSSPASSRSTSPAAEHVAAACGSSRSSPTPTPSPASSTAPALRLRLLPPASSCSSPDRAPFGDVFTLSRPAAVLAAPLGPLAAHFVMRALPLAPTTVPKSPDRRLRRSSAGRSVLTLAPKFPL